MKKQLRLTALILAIILVLSMSACAKDSGIVYQDDTVSVKEVTPSDKKTYSSMEWLNLSPEDYFGVPIIIAVGKVTNLRDVEVSYQKYGEPLTTRMALFDFVVSEYLLNTTSISSEKVLTVGHAFESDYLVQDVPILENGKEFILFLQHPDDMANGREDPMKRGSFMDVHILGPYQLMCEKVDSAYIVPPALRSCLLKAEQAASTMNMEQTIAARGTTDWSGFAVECDSAEQIIKEAAEAYLKGVS